MKMFKKVLARLGIFLGATLVIVLVAFLTMIYMVVKGPSTQVRNLFVTSMKETSAGGILADIFLTPEEVETILAQNSMASEGGITVEIDKDLIQIPDENANPEQPDIEIVDVYGALYRGKMMIVKDPSKVKVGVCDVFDPNGYGLKLTEICEKYGAIGGVNGGGYTDTWGSGKGGCPIGIVFSEGKLLYGNLNSTYDVYGFDKDNNFIVGRMTAQQAIDRGIRDAVSFGPALVVNGKPVASYGTSGGLNPRTAIGQRADGSVLLLVIDGRQATSIGATYADLVNVMLEFGAVNAANLDGGMSSSMVYEGGEILNNCSVNGARDIPTAFVVME